MSNKKKKVLSIITISCFVIMVIEFILMACYRFISEKNINRINGISDIIKIDGGYIAVGMSDFHNSHYINEEYYEYENSNNEKQKIITTQARIAMYNDNLKIIWENTIKAKYDSMFSSVLLDDDGYVAVGSFIKDKKQIESGARTAIIVKYDKTGKLLWKNTYSVLSDTRFNKVIKDGDDYIVIGQSIYENMEMGNHTTGGGIILRYNSEGEEIAHNNYGGNKSGNFTDIIIVDDGYIVCGKDATNYGIILKFAKNFSREENDTGLISNKILWNRTYSNTDNIGFTSMDVLDNTIYIVGALNVSHDKDESGNTLYKYDAGIVEYNLEGKYLESIVLQEDVHHRFNSVLVKDNLLYLSMQINVDSYYNGGNMRNSIMKYNLEKKAFEDEKTFKGDNDFVINKIKKLNDKLIYIGTENDTCTIRGCDYRPIIDFIK